VTPQYSHVVDTVTSPVKFAEVAIMLWLLIFGARSFGRRSDVTPESRA
jgi:hypothetical protein